MELTTILTRDSVVDIDKLLDEALQETFPGSDPVACAATASIAPAVRPATVGPVGHIATAPAKLAPQALREQAHWYACGNWPRPHGVSGSRIMKLTPLHDRLMVKRVEKERKIAGGIVIPATAGEKPDQGEVIAVGPGKRLQDGQTVRAGCEGWRPCAVREVRGRDRCRLRGSEKKTVTCTGRQKACAMKRRLRILVPAIVIAGLWSENAMSASPPLPTLPLQYDIWITGTIQRGSGKYAPGDYTTIMLDRPSTSPCNDKEVSDILLGEGGAPAPTLLLPYLNQRVAVRGRVICPGSGIQFTPQPDVVFPVW